MSFYPATLFKEFSQFREDSILERLWPGRYPLPLTQVSIPLDLSEVISSLLLAYIF